MVLQCTLHSKHGQRTMTAVVQCTYATSVDVGMARLL